MALLPGARVGPYEVVAQIGAGGMGEVYQATDTNLKRAVAIKVLPDAFAADAERLARFQREAQVLASLNHPNIAAIYGLERSDLTAAIAMELVDGPTLADRIAQGAVPADEAIAIARQIAEALEAAHEQGIVHRDLKPANVKVRADGVVKVLDFGLAKAVEPVAALSVSSSLSPTITTPAMTQAGFILGTAAYMSPEQARGKPVDKRTDIWAFGCVLFEMLTARRVFDAEDVSLTLAEVMKSDPDWTLLPSDVPAAVRLCLQRCFKKDPRQRLRDIGEARLALEGAREVDAPQPSTLSSASRSRLWPWLAAAAIVSALVGAAIALWARPAPSLPEVVRFEIHAPLGEKIPPGTPAVSPDGRTLAYVVSDAQGKRRIVLREMGAVGSRVLPGTENAGYVFWSADGRSLAFAAERTLKRIDIAGGSARDLVTQVGGPWHGAWNQFGDVLFQTGGINRVSAEGGETARIVTPDRRANEIGAAFPSFLSDGRRFVMLLNTTPGKSSLLLASLDSSERKVIVPDVLSAAVVAPTPPGRTFLLYVRNEALVAQEFDEASGQARGSARLLVDGIGRVANPPLRPTIGVSRSGVLAFQTGGDFMTVKLAWFNRAGQRVGDLPFEVSPNNVSLSSDGLRLAFDADSLGASDVWVMDLARNNTSRLTRTPEPERTPLWSPDGNRVVYSKSGKMYVKSADGSSEETVLADAGGVLRDWSPDGKYIVYEPLRAESGDRRLFLWPLGGGPAIPIGRRDSVAGGGRFSPDSHYLAYASDESGRQEIYLEALPPEKRRLKVSQTGGTNPRWTSSGRELFYMGADRTLMVVDVQLGKTLSAGVPRKLFETSGGVASRGFEVSPDGQRFLVRQLADDLPDRPITVVLNWWVDLLKPSN
jgi:eukaryotic-like serine/threonine-protein kinase